MWRKSANPAVLGCTMKEPSRKSNILYLLIRGATAGALNCTLSCHNRFYFICKNWLYTEICLFLSSVIQMNSYPSDYKCCLKIATAPFTKQITWEQADKYRVRCDGFTDSGPLLGGGCHQNDHASFTMMAYFHFLLHSGQITNDFTAFNVFIFHTWNCCARRGKGRTVQFISVR